jgi:hypothetical protein
MAARENADAMRAALNDQLRALEQLSNLSARERRDIIPPAMHVSLTAALCRAAERAGRRWRRGHAAGDRRSLVFDRPIGAQLARTRMAHARPDHQHREHCRAPRSQHRGAICRGFRAANAAFMVAASYTAEGTHGFDEVLERYKNELDFHAR